MLYVGQKIMNIIHTIFIAFCISIASAAEDQNVSAFIKAFPSAKPHESKPEDTVQHYTIEANISVEEVAARIGKVLNIQISILSAKDPKIFPGGEELKDKAIANLLMGGQFICLVLKHKESDKNYTATVVKHMEFTVRPDNGGVISPSGRESNIDMRLPSSTKEPKK